MPFEMAGGSRAIVSRIATSDDISWERSAVVASKYQPDASGSLYVITLTIRRPDGTTAPLQFTATYEQLSDLVGELKSAVKQVERERAP